jgi:hypothetical protein
MLSYAKKIFLVKLALCFQQQVKACFNRTGVEELSLRTIARSNK